MSQSNLVVHVSFYGKFRDMFGICIGMNVPERCSVGELLGRLAARYPESGSDLLGPRVRACVDDRIVPLTCLVAPGQTVELLAPVSGG